jgi:hypothetical protein
VICNVTYFGRSLPCKHFQVPSLKIVGTGSSETWVANFLNKSLHVPWDLYWSATKREKYSCQRIM